MLLFVVATSPVTHSSLRSPRAAPAAPAWVVATSTQPPPRRATTHILLRSVEMGPHPRGLLTDVAQVARPTSAPALLPGAEDALHSSNTPYNGPIACDAGAPYYVRTTTSDWAGPPPPPTPLPPSWPSGVADAVRPLLPADHGYS